MKSFDTLIFEEYSSLTEFAKDLKISDRMLLYWRTGEKFPSLPKIKKAAELLKQPESLVFESLSKINKKSP
jgi:transcriptional regulator with XRE-family HTH domain